LLKNGVFSATVVAIRAGSGMEARVEFFGENLKMQTQNTK